MILKIRKISLLKSKCYSNYNGKLISLIYIISREMKKRKMEVNNYCSLKRKNSYQSENYVILLICLDHKSETYLRK